jgi:hypothetical protein
MFEREYEIALLDVDKFVTRYVRTFSSYRAAQARRIELNQELDRTVAPNVQWVARLNLRAS